MRKEYNLDKLEKRKKSVESSPEAAKVPISLRLDGGDLSKLREEADRLGLPYQTLLGSIVHRYVTGELIEKRSVELLKTLSV